MSPVRPEERARYGADWKRFSDRVRFGRAAGRCECEGECGSPRHPAGRCPAEHDQASPFTGSRVVLTVAHLCHTPECRDHVKAMCQLCHLSYDRDHHTTTRNRRRGTPVTEQWTAEQHPVPWDNDVSAWHVVAPASDPEARHPFPLSFGRLLADGRRAYPLTGSHAARDAADAANRSRQ